MRISSNKYADVINFFRSELKDLYEKGEIETFIVFCFEEFLNVKKSELLLRSSVTMSESEMLRFTSVIKELKTHKPIQYILGKADFCGMKFKVNENVLIPRPETEELVEHIRSELRGEKFEVIDIGTGSGCIAIALKKIFPQANVSALDVSEKALELAKQNADLNKTEINFFQADILQPINQLTNQLLDLIVSNPPYIKLSEKKTMNKNVSTFEPHIALFVEDEDALIFYKAISDFALKHLTKNGKLFFEINESHGKEVQELLKQKGFKNIEIKKDLSGKDRMMVANRV